MKLNKKKSCAMIFKFTEKYKLTTTLAMEGSSLDIVEEAKLEEVIFTNDLKWTRSSQYLVKSVSSRMEILRRLSSFNIPVEDLVHVYILYIRSILEQSSVLWHSTITQENQADIERVQQNAFRNIFKEKIYFIRTITSRH